MNSPEENHCSSPKESIPASLSSLNNSDADGALKVNLNQNGLCNNLIDLNHNSKSSKHHHIEATKEKSSHHSNHSSSDKSHHHKSDSSKSSSSNHKSSSHKHSSDHHSKKEHHSSSKDKHKSDEHKSSKHKGDGDKSVNSEKSEKSKSESHKSKSDHDKHKSDKHRDSEKHKEGDKNKERHKHKDGEKHKHRDSSSSKHKEGDKHKSEHKSESSKHKESEKIKDPEKSKDGEKHRDSSSSKHKDGEKHKDSSSKHKDGEKHKDRDKHKDKDKHKEGEKHKHKDGEKHKSDKHKDGSSEKHKSSSDKHRDEKKSSGDHKSKDHHHKSKHRDSDKGKSKESHLDESMEDFQPKKKKEVDSGASQTKKKELNESYKDFEIKKEIDDERRMEIKKEADESAEAFVIKEERSDYSNSYTQVLPKEEPPSQMEEEDDDDDDDDDREKLYIEEQPMEEEPIKEESMSEDDVPLSSRQFKQESDSEDDEPLLARASKLSKSSKKRKKEDDDYEDSEDSDFGAKKPPKKKKKATKVEAPKKSIKRERSAKDGASTSSPRKKVKKEEEVDVWKWWEDEKLDDGQKWRTLSHKGPVFAPPYELLPKNVKFYYNGKHMHLSQDTEEVAGFYARMLDHDYVTKERFNNNFFKDWRKVMTREETEILKDLSKCNFKEIGEYYKMKSEERKAMTKEEKLAIKQKNEEMTAEYGFCIIDGHKQKIGNFKIEPPGLFRGRGEHPKMGMLKRRVQPEDVIINIGKEAEVPPPPEGHKWKEVRHDNTVTWLASWTENILGQTKYIMLNPSSKLKGEKDWQKYETARKLKARAPQIREEYQQDWKSKEMKVRQRAVALYFIDKLALRAGNEKEESETADTVGCCSLRVEHIELSREKDGKEYVVDFDFLGKDSIRYVNSVPVEKQVFKNLKLFMENKQPGDDLFDRLNTAILNKHLNELMEGLTAKVFRTYNASKTLQEQLDLLTKAEMSIPEKLLAYNRANRAVAILCNHQRSVPKAFSKQMESLQQKMNDKKDQIHEVKKELKQLKKEGGQVYERKKKRLKQLEEQLLKLEVQATDKEENKQIALGTSKLNYLDPRISVAWCKKWEVPIEKIYNKTQRDKFRWAIEMANADYSF